jgi:hypothetical protein
MTAQNRPTRVVALALIALTTCLVLLPAAPPASASTTQLSIMMDDDQLLYRGEAQRMATLRSMSLLGVTLIRATVLWADVAAHTKAPTKRNHFDPTNPAAYPRGAWNPYDSLLVDAQKFGIAVYFDVTGPGPKWAMGKTKDKAVAKAFMPNIGQFGKFVVAVGKRYSGHYPGSAGSYPGSGFLPRMALWSIWNEPNWDTWLAPQNVYSPVLHAVLPYSPILYRAIYYAARRALDATGHKNDYVMLGETQPLGLNPNNDTTPMRPAQFIRELFCVGRTLRPLTGPAASVRGCSDFAKHAPFRFSAWAHHPYTRSRPPTWTDPNRDSITLGNIAALPKLLDKIASSTHRLVTGLPIMVTEDGYSSNPPNPFRGVPLATQAAYINESDYLAYKQPRVFSMTQFEFRDSPPVYTARNGSRAYWATFQTGLTFQNGAAKPAYGAYALPIWVQSGYDSQGNQQLELWAQVRFRRYAGASDNLVFQFLPTGQTTWETVTTVNLAGSDGFADVTEPADPFVGGGQFRAVWAGPAAPYFAYSRYATFP